MRIIVDLPLPLRPSTIQRSSDSTVQSMSARIACPSSIRVTRIISIAGCVNWPLGKTEGAPHGAFAVGLGHAPAIAEATDERRATVAECQLIGTVGTGRRPIADLDPHVVGQPFVVSLPVRVASNGIPNLVIRDSPLCAIEPSPRNPEPILVSAC